MPLVLVTGSSDGIGKETARRLLAAGAEVIVHGRTQARADQAARELGTGRLLLPSMGQRSRVVNVVPWRTAAPRSISRT